MKRSDYALRDSLQLSVKQGVDWLTRWQKPNGEFKGCGKELAGYYKALYMFAVCGRLESGIRCLRYVKENLQNNKGELCSGQSKTSFPRLQRNLANYMDGWVAIGSWLLGDYGFANRLSLVLKSQQNNSHGGVATGPKKWSGRPRYDIATAASCGRAFFITGQHNAASAAADFLVEALKHQSDLKQGMDLCFDEKWMRLDAPDPSERTYYRLDLGSRGEKVWFPAFSCAFLCEMHQLSGSDTHLKAAMEYFRVIMDTIEFKEGTLANGKSGWSAGLLALATGQKKYMGAVKLIVPNVLKRQREDGEFGPSPRSQRAQGAGSTDQGGERSHAPLPRRLETTAEFTTWSAQYLRMHTLGLWNL